MWSYTGCHLQDRASDENSKSRSVLKGGQELLQPASLLAVKELHLYLISFIPDKLLHVDKLPVFKLC